MASACLQGTSSSRKVCWGKTPSAFSWLPSNQLDTIHHGFWKDHACETWLTPCFGLHDFASLSKRSFSAGCQWNLPALPGPLYQMLTSKWLKYQMISAYAHVLGMEPMTNALETLDFVPGSEQTYMPKPPNLKASLNPKPFLHRLVYARLDVGCQSRCTRGSNPNPLKSRNP